MRTLLAAIAAVAIAGCAARHVEARPANPVATPTASPPPAVRQLRTRVSVAKPLVISRTAPAPMRQTAAPTAAPTVAPTRVVVTASPQPTQTATATPMQSASPSPSPSIADVLLLPPEAAPQIMAMHIDRTTVRGGDTVNGWVITSSNVASVEARIGYYSIPVPKMSIGHFALSYVVPHLPFFLHRTYDMRVIARNAAGVEVVRTVPISVH